jgi:phage terminase small subunit
VPDHDRWRNAEEVFAEFVKADPRFRGLLIRTSSKGEGKGGGNTIQNPLIGIARSAMRDYLKFAAEFGLTPAARSRISTESILVAKGLVDPAEKYFPPR